MSIYVEINITAELAGKEVEVSFRKEFDNPLELNETMPDLTEWDSTTISK